MRVFASLLTISLALADPAAAQPRRVASLNLCTDELLLALAAPGQIASVTHLSRDAAESPYWRQARRYRANDGSLLSVVSLRPDLVITTGGGGRDRRRIADRLGIATIDLPFPNSLADVETAIDRLARALGRQAAGTALLRRLATLKSSAPRGVHDALWIGGGGRTVPARGLAADWMRLAGLRQRATTGDTVSLETLVSRPPEILLRSDYRAGQYSSAQRWLTHPLARRVRGSRSLATDGRRWTCMGPLLIDEIERLRSEVVR